MLRVQLYLLKVRFRYAYFCWRYRNHVVMAGRDVHRLFWTVYEPSRVNDLFRKARP